MCHTKNQTTFGVSFRFFASRSMVKDIKTGTYYCPMHPEVISDKAGTCPECGMNLELKKK
ncbi:MAG: heavy metal-binding domain-containing protein [Bacteroidota bacterium]